MTTSGKTIRGLAVFDDDDDDDYPYCDMCGEERPCSCDSQLMAEIEGLDGDDDDWIHDPDMGAR
jgi:hypothetical protein